ncbi:hypothetical protein GCM10023142_11010 [Anaerocolumna aminovalerica]|uniref:Uncharacterized protein n=1 Tax=Anaerocolumna aminovalerica TaxID=1527 RepID=A0A1I5IYP6_9FIRM|nr:hypothetical protein [Anaerocolumna aminovalerica]SFO65480.1 hypothetical protein SAMN04489757_15715 [Anaerocolumna aminovalerica]
MDLRIKIAQIIQLQEELESKGYEGNEALGIIQTAAMCMLTDCLSENYNGQPYIRIHGSIATYEQ